MLEARYYPSTNELLIDGHQPDFERLAAETRELFSVSDRNEVSVAIASSIEAPIERIVVRKGPPPNRVHCEPGTAVFSIAPTLLRQFLSFIEFPADNELPNSPVQYHHL